MTQPQRGQSSRRAGQQFAELQLAELPAVALHPSALYFQLTKLLLRSERAPLADCAPLADSSAEAAEAELSSEAQRLAAVIQAVWLGGLEVAESEPVVEGRDLMRNLVPKRTLATLADSQGMVRGQVVMASQVELVCPKRAPPSQVEVVMASQVEVVMASQVELVLRASSRHSQVEAPFP